MANFARDPHRGYSLPVSGSWGHWHPEYFWLRLCPRLPAGTPWLLVKPHPIPSPADELRLRPPTKAMPTHLGAPGAFWRPDLWALILDGVLPTTIGNAP